MTIAEHIEQDLRVRLRRPSTGPRLTIDALAREYGVSPTPVRRAIDALVTDGVLERLANGRLAVAAVEELAAGAANRPGRRRRAAASRAPDPADALSDQVEREVLMLSLRGEHGFLREQAFAERLGVGRTRLRRALHELAGAGLVEHVERCGWRARPVRQSDVRAFLDVRATLEAQALDLARPHLDDSDLQRFADGNDMAAVRRRKLDNGLHAYFVARSQNQYIAAFFQSHGRFYMRLFDHATVDRGRTAEMAGQHREILAHARARRWAKARRALQHHIHSQAPVLGAVLARLETDSPR